MIKNTASEYGLVSKLFHWLMFLIIVGMLIVGFYMSDLENSPFKLELYWWHKSFGILILTLVALRLSWRLYNIIPLLPSKMHPILKLMAGLSHFVMYIMMAAMPITGWLMSSAAGFNPSFFGLFELPAIAPTSKDAMHFYKELHEIGAFFFIFLITLHILAALYHHFIRRDTILKRMLPYGKVRHD